MILIWINVNGISIGKGKGGNQAAYSFCGIFDGQGHVISNFDTYNSLTPNWYYKVLR